MISRPSPPTGSVDLAEIPAAASPQVLEPFDPELRFNGMGKATMVVVAASLVFAACAAGTETPASIPPPITPATAVEPLPAITTPPSTATSTTTAPTPSTTAQPPQPVVDVTLIADARYLTTEWRGEDTVLATNQGEIVSRWVDNIVRPGGVANDGHGGIVWAEGEKLWWFPADASVPQLVPRVGEIWWGVSRAPLGANPSVRIDGDVLDLVTGETAKSTAGPLDELRAGNGLLARVVEAETHRDSEGFVDRIVEPAHLQVWQDDTVLFDIPVGGGVLEDFVAIEDFDGQRLIIKRIPEEPANATETFIVFDLADGTIVERWRGALSTAALVGNQVETVPDVVAPDMTQLCSTWTGATAVVPQAGLSPFIQGTRTSILAALQTCDFSGLGWLGPGAPADAADWDSAMFATLEETLTMPFAETAEAIVWPKWAGVTSADELSTQDLELMRARYDADVQEVIESPDQYGVIILRIDRLTAIPRLQLPVGC